MTRWMLTPEIEKEYYEEMGRKSSVEVEKRLHSVFNEFVESPSVRVLVARP
jgi:hypothetical protein